jgi:hypothetical protein
LGRAQRVELIVVTQMEEYSVGWFKRLKQGYVTGYDYRRRVLC